MSTVDHFHDESLIASKMSEAISQSHWPTTLLVASTRQIIYPILLFISSKLIAPFDSSHLILDKIAGPGVRWDSLHYMSIAMDGYQYEQQLAFMPLWPAIMRISGECSVLVRRGMSRIVPIHLPLHITHADLALASGVVNSIASVMASVYLYKLTRTLTGSHRFASLSCAFYAIIPHPAAAASPYTEPIYALFTFMGFYYAVKRRWAVATACLALTTGIRATGVLNIGVLGWQILFGSQIPSKQHLISLRIIKRCFLAALLCSIVIPPFVLFQYYAYLSFCQDVNAFRPWCNSRMPISYSSVQAQYWHIGLFNYWTVAQLPNFLMAAPVLLVSVIPTFSYFRTILFGSKSARTLIPYHPALLPFQIHHLALTLLLIFASHTQIALRVCITDPVVWWNTTSIAFDWTNTAAHESGSQVKDGLGEGGRMTRAGKLWTGWVLIWSAISLFLWAGHYPPA